MQPSTLAKRASILLFLAVTAFYFYGLGQLPLIGPDEPRYAQVAREMFLRGDPITPTLGGHLWFEKPALLYWMMIASFKLFGVSEWSARLPSAVSGLLTISAVFLIARKTEQRSSDERLTGLPFWSALVTATTLGIAVFSRAASFDIVLTMTTAWALALFILYDLDENPKSRQRFLFGFYVFIGLSLLAKGLVGIVVPSGVVVTYYVLRRRLPERSLITSLLWGIPLTLFVAALWYVPVIWKHGGAFIEQFFIQQHFARFVTNKYRHPGPFYYYLPILFLFPLPWTFFLIDGFLKGRNWLWRAPEPEGNPLNRIMIFAIAWFLFPLIFFSFSNSKLPGYILPVVPGLALIIGERLTRINSDDQNHSWALKATAALYLLAAIGTSAYAWRSGKLSHTCTLLLAGPLAVAGGFALASARRQAASILIGAAVFAVMVVALHCQAGKLAEQQSTKHLIQLADSRGYSNAVVYGLQIDDRTPEFYAAGRVVYGPDGEPVIYQELGQVIDESRRRGEVVLTLVPLVHVPQLPGLKGVETEFIGSNETVALVALRAL